MTTAKDLDPDENFVAREFWGMAMGEAMSHRLDWQLYLLGPEVQSARQEWATKLTALKEDYFAGVKAAFVPPPLPPGPYHVFFDDRDEFSFEGAYLGSYADFDGLQIGTNRTVNYSTVVAYDPTEQRLRPIGTIEDGTWLPAALKERLDTADDLALADLQLQEPELYLRAFPPYPKGQTLHIPKYANLTPLLEEV